MALKFDSVGQAIVVGIFNEYKKKIMNTLNEFNRARADELFSTKVEDKGDMLSKLLSQAETAAVKNA